MSCDPPCWNSYLVQFRRVGGFVYTPLLSVLRSPQALLGIVRKALRGRTRREAGVDLMRVSSTGRCTTIPRNVVDTPDLTCHHFDARTALPCSSFCKKNPFQPAFGKSIVESPERIFINTPCVTTTTSRLSPPCNVATVSTR